MSGELGRATYELDADLGPLRRNVKESERVVGDFERTLDALTAISGITEEALKQIKITARQAGESDASAESIIAGVRGISDESRDAARELDRVRISEAQAAESTVAGERIKRNVNDIGDEADRTKRKLEEVRLAGGRNGAGVGPFGSGFGRVGVMGTAIGAGVLTGPAAAPAALGILASLPVLAGVAGGAVGTLALALDGVGKAIGGDKKAFDELTPSAKEFTLTVRSLHGWIEQLKETAARNLFPGLAAGLKDALSPGTVNAITVAVTALGRALGNAGEAWGRYFGSAEFQSIFGPLMQSAARNVGALSQAALSLLDAIGVLGRAAIPLTDWMTGGIAKGAQLVDTWLHAKDATGQLGGAMREAQTSLRLVGGLIESLLRAVGSLGSALYPVSKVAVKDLSDGLNALADIIDRNKQAIRDIVGGALAAFVSAVKAAKPVVAALAQALMDVASVVGGWKIAFELVLGGALVLRLAKVGAALSGVGDAALTSMGSVERFRLGLVSLSKMGPIVIAVGLDYFIHKYGADNAIQAGLNPFKSLGPDVAGDTVDPLTGHNAGSPADKAALARLRKSGSVGLDPGIAAAMQTGSSPGVYSQRQIYQLLLANGLPKDVATNLAIISAKGEDSSGDPTRLNDNPKTGDYSVGLFQENFIGRMGVDRVKRYAPMFGLSPSTPVSAFVSWLGKHPSAQAQIALDIYNSQGYSAWTTARGLGITDASSASPFGDVPAWTKNLDPKPPHVSPIPPMVSDLLNQASANASKSKQLGNAGGTAKRYLEQEYAELQTADKQLAKKLTSVKGKDATQIKMTMTSIENKIRDVQTNIAKSMLATGCTLIPLPQKASTPAPAVVAAATGEAVTA